MKRVCVTLMALLGVLFSVCPASALTITFDGVLDEWIGGDVVSLGTEAAGSGGNYTFLATWDASNLYLGMDRDSTDRYLGDTYLDNDSFFVAIDTDGIAGSGAALDGYGRMNFGGTMLPDMVFYYAGGSGWFESSTWDSGNNAWNWNGWTNSGTYYGWQEDNPDDELSIALSTIGGSHEVMVWAWMTPESDGEIKATWPSGFTGPSGGQTFGDGIVVPEPATMALLGLGALAMLGRKK